MSGYWSLVLGPGFLTWDLVLLTTELSAHSQIRLFRQIFVKSMPCHCKLSGRRRCCSSHHHFLRGKECCVSLSSLPFSPGHKPELPWTGHIEGTAHTIFKIFRFPFNHSKWNCCTFYVPGHMPDNENSIRFPVTLCNFSLLVSFTAMIMTCKFCSFTCLFVLILEHKPQEVELFSVVFISISPKFRSMLDMF